ncbi:MAG: hypothetical protein JXR10_17510 [Cyclobacteriaceae bacterium]
MNHHFIDGTRAGTVGGTLLSIIPNLNSADLVKTAILAAVGALVSFTISILLKWVVKAFGKRNVPKV